MCLLYLEELYSKAETFDADRFINLDMNFKTGDIYVLSQNPYADCFFCGYGGPETAIELVLKPGHDDFLMDELVTVTGKFKLLYDDVTSGVYRLTDAVAVKE